jgi:hypothetical protein
VIEPTSPDNPWVGRHARERNRGSSSGGYWGLASVEANY